MSALTGAAKLVGQDIGEKMNPITTLGSMQVHINYAKANKRSSMNTAALRDDLYTEYGGTILWNSPFNGLSGRL